MTLNKPCVWLSIRSEDGKKKKGGKEGKERSSPKEFPYRGEGRILPPQIHSLLFLLGGLKKKKKKKGGGASGSLNEESRGERGASPAEEKKKRE